MKTERRHELQTNQLADSLGHWLEALRPYGRVLAGIAVAAVLLIAGMAYVSAQNKEKQTAGWTDFWSIVNEISSARDATQMNDGVNKLDEFKKEYPGTPIDYWSRVVAADFRLSSGTSELFKDKAEGRSLLNEALEDYQYVAKTARDPMLLQRAYFGLARTNESLGDLKAAEADYKEVVQRWPKGPYAAMSAKRAEDLDQNRTKEFYDWFAKYQPPKAPAAGERPIFDHDSLLNSVPSTPSDMKLPSVVDLLDSGNAATTPPTKTEEPGKTEPAKTEEPAKAEQPNKEEPKKEEPAGDAKPEVKTETPAPATTPEAKPDAAKPEAPKEPELKLPDGK